MATHTAGLRLYFHFCGPTPESPPSNTKGQQYIVLKSARSFV